MVSLYASDKILNAPSEFPSSVTEIQDDINRIMSWCRARKLQINASEWIHHYYERSKHSDQPTSVNYMEKERCYYEAEIIPNYNKFD